MLEVGFEQSLGTRTKFLSKKAHEEAFSRSIESPIFNKRGDSRFSKSIRKNENGIQILSEISEKTGITT
jgi:hypothetical protein